MNAQRFHPEPQSAHVCGVSSRNSLRVPFGLRDGRVWAPREVEPGLACRCVCPACRQPLVAKAIDSRKRVAHFAHHGEVACETGAETGIHMRAKQVICDHKRLMLPGWGGDLLERPNPPTALDNLRRVHEGEHVDYPGGQTQLEDVQEEYTMDGFKPDVYATDGLGELLIEIRYSHAVDEAKAARVREGGYRMVEIDLSGMDRDTPHDPDAFDRLVLDEPANRTWICCPPAESEWDESKKRLDLHIDEINRQIEEDIRKEQREAQQRLAQLKADQESAKGRRAYMQQKLRTPYLDALAQLPSSVAPARVVERVAELERDGALKLDELRQGLPQALDHACMASDEDDWIYGISAPVWRAWLLHHFVLRQAPGYRFNNRDVFQFVRRTFPIEEGLYRLFLAQYNARRQAREAGYSKRRLNFWAFTDEENELIPNFYLPVNRFMDRLAYIGLLKHLPTERGGLEVVEPPAHGLLPTAVVDAGPTNPVGAQVPVSPREMPSTTLA